MSRRVPNPAADRAAKNQQTIKGLLKLEGNKSCADCKRNKRMLTLSCFRHDLLPNVELLTRCYRSKMGELEPGHFCLHSVRTSSQQTLSSCSIDCYVRCSGIHRGMGTHISRVKSVDLDAWTDEQLASVMAWGNSRANKYRLLYSN